MRSRMLEGQCVVCRELLAVAIGLAAALCATATKAEVLIGLAGPITGKEAWLGEQFQRGAELAVADLNAAGGVLGQKIQLITVDDFCDPEQAVAAARKLVSDGVILVVGHMCSGASIPASEIYEAAGVLMISPYSSNPMLTELGRANVFRVVPRDDTPGIVAGNYLADHWSDKKIAILHDDTVYGKGIAELTKEQLNRRGVSEVIYRAFVPGRKDYAAEIGGTSGGGYRRALHRRIPHRGRAHGTCGKRPRLPGSTGGGQRPDGRGFWPDCRARGRGNAVR